MPRFLPPAGTPLSIADVFRAQRTALLANGNLETVLTVCGSRLAVRNVFATRSGRSALWLVLKALRRLRPDRSVVAVPAYTCFTVAAAVVRAGLKLHPVDIDPETLDFNFAELDAVPASKLLCIVSSNLFGFVNDVERIQNVALAKGAFAVDDAAQALGASRKGWYAGTHADAGLFSFGRGKVVAAVEGGLLVTNSENISDAIRIESDQGAAGSLPENAALLLQLLAYAAFLNPRLYWVPNSLPFLKLGTTEFNPEFRTGAMPAVCLAMLPQLMEKIPEHNRIRARNADLIRTGVAGMEAFALPSPAPDSEPSYLRFPLLAREQRTRNRAVAALRSAGIGASPFYPSAICDIPGIDGHLAERFLHCPEAESVSRRLLTLPTHSFVGEHDISRMLDILERTSREAA